MTNNDSIFNTKAAMERIKDECRKSKDKIDGFKIGASSIQLELLNDLEKEIRLNPGCDVIELIRRKKDRITK